MDRSNVGGVAGTTSIATFTANGYNSLEYTWVSGDTFKIGNFGAATLSTDPVDFSVPVQVVDGDGDTASGNLGIIVTSPGSESECIGGHCREFAHSNQHGIIGNNSFQRGRDWIRP